MALSRIINVLFKNIQEHEHSLRVILDDDSSSFRDILGKNIDITDHQWKIQVLITKLFKIRNNLAPLIMDNIFTPRENNFNLKNFLEFATEQWKAVKYGTKSVSYFFPLFSTLVLAYFAKRIYKI